MKWDVQGVQNTENYFAGNCIVSDEEKPVCIGCFGMSPDIFNLIACRNKVRSDIYAPSTLTKCDQVVVHRDGCNLVNYQPRRRWWGSQRTDGQYMQISSNKTEPSYVSTLNADEGRKLTYQSLHFLNPITLTITSVGENVVGNRWNRG
jgi:hypothetical protein